MPLDNTDADTGGQAPAQPAPLTFDSVRQKFPQYHDLSDEQLAQGLHNKFYHDLPFDAFAAKIGYRAQKQEPQDDVPTEIIHGAQKVWNAPGQVLGPAVQGFVQGAKEGYQAVPKGTILSDEAQAKLDEVQRQGGWKGTLAGLGSTAAEDIGAIGGAAAGAGNALFGGLQRGIQRTGEALGASQAGRDIAAIPEAFMGSPEELTAGTHHQVAVQDRESMVMARAMTEADPLRGAAAKANIERAAAPHAEPATPEAAAAKEAAEHPEPPTPITQNPEPKSAITPTGQGGPPINYQMVDPDQIKLDPERFQFKESDEKGRTGALAGVTKWEPALANPITLWQDTDGSQYVVNGHQRTNLARDAKAAGQPDVQMPAQVFKAEDGYTPEFMRRLGAYQNMAEGSGTALDAARVLKAEPEIPDKFTLPLFPPSSAALLLSSISPPVDG